MDHIKSLIRTIPDFPKAGIQFRDLTTLFLNGPAFAEVVGAMAAHHRALKCDVVAAVEARGFILGAPLAVALGKPFVPLRKPGKLPGPASGVDYVNEYGNDRLEIHSDALKPGDRALMVDDLLATGGTMRAACDLMERVGVEVAACAFLVELVDLKGRQKLDGYPIYKLVDFAGE